MSRGTLMLDMPSLLKRGLRKAIPSTALPSPPRGCPAVRATLLPEINLEPLPLLICTVMTRLTSTITTTLTLHRWYAAFPVSCFARVNWGCHISATLAKNIAMNKSKFIKCFISRWQQTLVSLKAWFSNALVKKANSCSHITSHIFPMKRGIVTI